MPEILKTKRIGSELEELISEAKSFICIFTYSLIIDNIYMERLKAAGKRGVSINFVYGVEPKTDETLKALSEIPGCKVYYKQYLHAKFYYNESVLIIASMNLSEVSEKKNFELGVLFHIADHPEAFVKIRKEAKEIVESATLWEPKKTVKKLSAVISTPNMNLKQKGGNGFCIRCKSYIDKDVEKPFCYNCFTEWAIWENPDYEENFCHTCGKKDGNLSLARPQCYTCYQWKR